MRKKNSLFDQVCNFINTIPVGSTFTNEELYSNTNEYMSDYKVLVCKGDRQTTRYYRYHLIHANVVQRVSKGIWKVLAHIPEGVTLSMVEQEKYKNGKKRTFVWKAGVELPKTKEIKMDQNEITIFEITKNNLVLPVTVAVTRVPSLLSTGSYFENEYDAAYFLSVGTGVPVEDIIKKSHDFINTGDEAEDWEKELIERLDGLLVIQDNIGNSMPWKWIYKFDFDKETVIKRKAHIDEVALESSDENESLLRLLQLAGGSVKLWTEIADELIEKLSIPKPNEALTQAADSYKTTLTSTLAEKESGKTYQISERKDEVFEKSLLMEDIRGKQVYFMKEGRPSTGKVKSFMIDCKENETPVYSMIDVDTVSAYKLSATDVSFSKEDFKKKLASIVDSL